MTTCERDKSHGPASHWVKSEIISLKVCDQCAVEAYDQINWQRSGRSGNISIEPFGVHDERSGSNGA